MRAYRCSWWLCTPPSLSRPNRCTRPDPALALAKASVRAACVPILPSSTARLIRTRSWNSTWPAPMVRCPTSELPIVPAGRPTARPDPSTTAQLAPPFLNPSITGVSACLIALPCSASRSPHPSMTISAARFGIAFPPTGLLCTCARGGKVGKGQRRCEQPLLRRQVVRRRRRLHGELRRVSVRSSDYFGNGWRLRRLGRLGSWRRSRARRSQPMRNRPRQRTHLQGIT